MHRLNDILKRIFQFFKKLLNNQIKNL